MPIGRVDRRSVSDAVFVQLRDEILSGAIAAGEVLPSERALSELTGVNRQAVREALKRLDQAGLVAIAHGGPTRVRDFRNRAGLDLLPALLVRSDGTVDGAVLRSVMEMRACIGPDAARRCAERAVRGTVEALVTVVDAMAATDDLAALGALDWRFWELVVDGADNLAYRLAFNSLRDAAEPLVALEPEVLAAERLDRRGHRAIARAIAEGDAPRAESAARRLLAKGVGAVASSLLGGGPR